jgi:hypothetical protein
MPSSPSWPNTDFGRLVLDLVDMVGWCSARLRRWMVGSTERIVNRRSPTNAEGKWMDWIEGRWLRVGMDHDDGVQEGGRRRYRSGQ